MKKVEKNTNYIEKIDFFIPGCYPFSSLKFCLLKRYKTKIYA